MTIPDCTLRELCRWAETWLPTLAPADMPGPVYILDARLPDRIEACTGAALDLAYCSELGKRWRGRGVAILVDLDKFRLDIDRLREVNHADDATIATMQGYVARRLLRVLLHELAHATGWKTLSAETHETQRHARQVIDYELWTPATAADPRLPAPFDGHGADFARSALHLHYRARWQGVVLPLVGLAAGWKYGMGKIEAYRQALGNECWRLRDASFRKIAATPPPKRFAELWQRDVASWLRSCAAIGELTDEIFRAAWHAANVLPGCEITRDRMAAVVAA